jgi:hypothetical protein
VKEASTLPPETWEGMRTSWRWKRPLSRSSKTTTMAGVPSVKPEASALRVRASFGLHVAEGHLAFSTPGNSILKEPARA